MILQPSKKLYGVMFFGMENYVDSESVFNTIFGFIFLFNKMHGFFDFKSS